MKLGIGLASQNNYYWLPLLAPHDYIVGFMSTLQGPQGQHQGKSCQHTQCYTGMVRVMTNISNQLT